MARPKARHSVFLAELLNHLDKVAFGNFFVAVEILDEKLFIIVNLDIKSVVALNNVFAASAGCPVGSRFRVVEGRAVKDAVLIA